MADEVLKVSIIGDASKLSTELSKAGAAMTVFGAAITAAFVVTVKKAADFQTQMAQVSTML
ncbi:MAG TPA: hypothetical protein VMV86_06505, partial [Methanosarcinales archaeon]|nr:hypothetical protein [Methanosarcinales archaeon]